MNYVLPGMGASSAMYSREWKALDGYLFIDWPCGFKGKTIGELAECVVSTHSIRKSDSVIGSSLGGMVAGEIANQMDVKHLVLIGSAKQKEEVSRVLALLSPLIDFAPIEFVRRAAGKVPEELAQMFHESDPVFVRNMCRAIFRWEGFSGDSRLFRIHGVCDRIIPCPTDADVLLDGGHLIAMTHAAACIAAIKGNR